MTDIKELALKVAKDIGYWDEQEEYILDFATRLIAAYAEGQEPVLVISDYKKAGRIARCTHTKYGETVSLPSGTKLFTAPPEPAPQQSDRDRQHEHTMKQFQEVCHGRNCTANKAQPTHSDECKADHDKATACEAPSSEEVARTVELLRINHWIPGNTKAADLIERLAARVPDERLATLEQQNAELVAALNSALEIVTTDRCDGDSAFANGVNAACERHAIWIRNIIEGVKK